MEWLPGKNAALSASCAHRRRDRQPAADLPVPGQRPGRGRAGQAPRARHDRRPPDPADGAGRVVRRHRPARAAARRARQHRRDGPGQAAGDPRRDLAADARRRDAPRPRPGRAPRRRGVRRLHPARRRLALRDQGRPDPRRPARARPGAGRARPGSTWCSRSCAPPRSGAASRPRCPGLRAALGLKENAEATDAVDADRGAGAGAGAADGGRRLGTRRRRRAARRARRCSGCCTSPPTQVVPRLARTTDELDAVLHALDGGFIPAGPSGSPLRGLVNVLPTGRNFYTVDPRAVPSRLAWETGRGDGRVAGRSATSTRPASYPESVGPVASGAPARCAPPATTSPRCSRCSACGRSGTRRRAGSATCTSYRWRSWAVRAST